jgi:hypothetical protein
MSAAAVFTELLTRLAPDGRRKLPPPLWGLPFEGQIARFGLHGWRFRGRRLRARPHLLCEFLEHVSELLIRHQAGRFDENGTSVEKNFAARSGYHELASRT